MKNAVSVLLIVLMFTSCTKKSTIQYNIRNHYFFYYEGKKVFIYLKPSDELNITFYMVELNETYINEDK